MILKNFIFNNFIAGRIAKLFGGIKGYKTQIGTLATIALTLAKYFAPIPVEYLPYIDQIIAIVVGATGVSFGDKVRRKYELGKVIVEEIITVTGEAPKNLP